MTIQEAIEKAIEGGYLSEDIRGRKAEVELEVDILIIQAGNFEMTVPESMVFLDHLFWHSLGKELGWKDRIYTAQVGHVNGYHDKEVRQEKWRKQWHRLIDALAEGRTAEEYFETLS